MACTAEDITCAIRGLTEALQHVGPSPLEVATFVVTCVGVLASAGIGLAAWQTSRRATEIAKSARDAEAARDRAAYEDALTSALADFVQATAIDDDRSIATAALDAAQLRARGEDAEVLGAVARWWRALSNQPPSWGRSTEVPNEFMRNLQAWRAGFETPQQTIVVASAAAQRLQVERSLRGDDPAA